MVYAPQNASVFITCVMDSSNSFWAIDLAGDDFDIFFQFSTESGREYLNDHGVYQLPPTAMLGMLSAQKLLINNTDINNHTIIKCFDGNKLYQTTLYLYSKLCHFHTRTICFFIHTQDLSLTLELCIIASLFYSIESSGSVLTAEETGTEQSLNISLTDPDQSRLENINLTVVNMVNQKWTFQLQNPYRIFTAPEGASPCEIYSFKMSHTYVGAAYTGAGCGVSSPVLSIMLPSLPGINRLQSSHNYSLEKLTRQLVLTVYFQVSNTMYTCTCCILCYKTLCLSRWCIHRIKTAYFFQLSQPQLVMTIQ
jgi:hypothetical protein